MGAAVQLEIIIPEEKNMKVKYTKCDICGNDARLSHFGFFNNNSYVLKVRNLESDLKYKLDICQECMDKIVQYVQSKIECQEDERCV